MNLAIVDLPGPQFLVLYAFVAVVTVYVCRRIIRARDLSWSLGEPRIPDRPDPSCHHRGAGFP